MGFPITRHLSDVREKQKIFLILLETDMVIPVFLGKDRETRFLFAIQSEICYTYRHRDMVFRSCSGGMTGEVYNMAAQKDNNTYERILAAGAKLFAQKGFAGTTTREIVNEAGASLSSLQQYFGSKEKIYTDAVDKAMKSYAARMDQDIREAKRLEEMGMLRGDTAWDTLSGIIIKHCDWVFDPQERDAIFLMNRQMLDPEPLMDVPPEAMQISDVIARLADACVGAQDSLWARLLSHEIVIMLFGVANYPGVLSHILGKDIRQDATREEVKLLLRDYLLTSVRAYLDVRRGDSRGLTEKG